MTELAITLTGPRRAVITVHLNLSGVVQAAAKQSDGAEVVRALSQIAEGIEGMSNAIKEIWVRCMPAAFYDHVRVLVQGEPEPGIMFEGGIASWSR